VLALNVKKMKTYIQFLLLILCVSFLSSCATWKRIGDKAVIGPKNRFSVELPKGWMRYSADKKAITATRDGLSLQMIRIGFWPHKKSHKSLKKKTSDTMLPSELAELVVAMIRKSSSTKNAKIVENKPMKLVGKQGFKVKLAFKNTKGLRFKRDIYGFATKEGIYFLMYQAPVLHFYPKHKHAFDAAVSSFKLTAKKKK